MFAFIRRHSVFFIFFLALLWFSFLQPWGSFRDPDGFYHAKVTDIILHGSSIEGVRGTQVGSFFFLQNFPWLDLTLLDQYYVDQHLLYHVLLIPFVRAFGMLWGAQVGAVIFSAGFIAIFYAVLRWLRVQNTMVWALLTLFCVPLAFRLSLVKATPLALMAFVVGMGAVLQAGGWRREAGEEESGRAWRFEGGGLLAGFIFSLVHGGWMMLLLMQGIFVFGTWLFKIVIERRRVAFRDEWSRVSVIVATMAGIFLGLCLHPNRANVFEFLKVQVFQVAVITPGNISLGLEWTPVKVGEFFGNMGPLFIAACVVILGCVFALRRPLDMKLARGAFGLGVVVCALTVLVFKSSRMLEYFVPMFVLWLATLWSLIDIRVFWLEVKAHFESLLSLRQRRLFTSLLIVLFCALFVHDVRLTYTALRLGNRSFGRLASTVQTMSRHVQVGQRVFHDRWDSFPELFALAPQFRYISGVDPTFLFARQPELGEAYEAVTRHLDSSFPLALQTSYMLFERTECRKPAFILVSREGRTSLCRIASDVF